MATKSVNIKVNIIGKTVIDTDTLKVHIYKESDNIPICTYYAESMKSSPLTISFNVKEDTDLTDYYARLFYNSWSNGTLVSITSENMIIDFDLTTYNDDVVLGLVDNDWYPIYDKNGKGTKSLGYGIKLTNLSSPNISSQKAIVDSSFVGGTVIVEMCSNSNNQSGTYLSYSTTSGSTSISAVNKYYGENVYSFSESVRNKPVYAEFKSNNVFAIHTTSADINNLRPRFIGPANYTLLYNQKVSEYSVGKCFIQNSGLNDWVSYNSTDNKDYYSITVTEKSQCIQQEINLEYGYQYTFKLHTCSEAGSDGIVLSYTNTSTASSIGSISSYVTMISGVDGSSSHTITPTENKTIYLYFITDSDSTVAGIDSTTSGEDPSGCEYGDVEITKVYYGADVILKENGVQGYLNNFVVPDNGIKKTYLLDRKGSLPKFTTTKSDDYCFADIWTIAETYNESDAKTTVLIQGTNVGSRMPTLFAQNLVYFRGYVCKKTDGSDSENELEPVSGVKINFTDLNGTTLGSVLSDDNGYVEYTTYYSINHTSIQVSLNSIKYMLVSSEDKINISAKSDKNQFDKIEIEEIDTTDLTGIGPLVESLNKVSAYNIKTIINNDNADYSDDTFKMKVIEPDAVSTYDIFTSSPVIISDAENVVGSVDICLKSDANNLRLKTINRYSGYYNPIFKDILFYNNYTDDGTTSYSNTSFDENYVDNYGQFGVINDMWMHKVNEDDSSKVVTYLDPYYPLIGQYALDYRDYNVFSSNWDMNYYTKQVDTTHNESCKNIRSMKNGLCMFGSKYLNTPNEIEIYYFNGCEDWNDDWITDTDGCSGEVMYKEKNNTTVEYYFFLRKRILRFFCDKLESEFKKYIDENQSYGGTGLDDDIKAYVENNILKLYQLDRIRMFVRRTKSNVANNQIENDYTTYLGLKLNPKELLGLGFEEVNTLSMNKISLDDFDRKVVYNLRTGEKEEFGFSFKISKI